MTDHRDTAILNLIERVLALEENQRSRRSLVHNPSYFTREATLLKDAGLAVRTLNILSHAGFAHLHDIGVLTVQEALRLKNSGRVTVQDMADALHREGLDFRSASHD